MNLFVPTVAAAALSVAALGMGSYTFVYARGASYLSNDPSACANCHVMEDHHSAWLKSSHAKVATCNDCHAPRDGVVGKLAVKATNGALHAYAFTTGEYPDALQIRAANAEVTEAACRSCHVIADLIAGSAHAPSASGDGRNELSCIQCHRTVGHWVR